MISLYTISLHQDDGAGSDSQFASMDLPPSVAEEFVLSLAAALDGVPGGPFGYHARITRSDTAVAVGNLAVTPPTFN
jgi:hypothetical protein